VSYQCHRITLSRSHDAAPQISPIEFSRDGGMGYSPFGSQAYADPPSAALGKSERNQWAHAAQLLMPKTVDFRIDKGLC
jgi:hypothetical protein